MKLPTLLVLSWAMAINASAQHFQYKYYTEKDGLSSKDINCVITDHDGFIWVATSSGLNRFDGNTFKTFYNNPTDSNSIADNNVQKLFTDIAGRLWIGTNAGISLYHPVSNSFSNYSPDTLVLPRQGISFGALYDDDNNNIWVGTKNDLLVFNTVTKKFNSSGWAGYVPGVAPADGNHSRVIVLSFAKKSDTELWILSSYGLFSVNIKTKAFQFYINPVVKDYFGYSMDYVDKSGNVWLSTYGNGIFYFSSAANKWSDNYIAPFPNSNITNSIKNYAEDTMMYCLDNTIVLFDTRQRKIVSAINYADSEAAKKYGPETGKSLLHYHNQIWVGTNKGLVRATPFSSPFHFVALTEKNEVNRVFKLKAANAFLFSVLNNNYTTYFKNSNGSITPVLTLNKQLLHSNYQYCAEAADGTIYLNDEEQVYKYNSKTNIATVIPIAGKATPPNGFGMRNMVIDREGTVWVRAFDQGILKYDSTAGKPSLEMTIAAHGAKEINAMYYDSIEHTLWYSEEFNGVFSYNIATKQTVHYGLNKPPVQRNAAVVYISGNGKGKLWMCDLQAGLIEYDYQNNTFIRLTENEGLLSNNCFWTVVDTKGMLWISTDKGLCRYDPLQKKFTAYQENEGLPAAPPTYLSADNEGNVYMPNKKGYYVWNTADVKDKVKEGKIFLSDALLFNWHLNIDTTYSFLYKENSIEFLFGLLSYEDRDAVILEYSLNSHSWVTTDFHSYISFANLAPGKYDLAVRIKHEHIPELHIHFTIAKAFWQQWWFFVLLFAGLLAVIVLLVSNRLQRYRNESSLKQKAMESEMSALRSQMNPHFIFNTLNSINSYIIENKKDEASEYLTDFSRLIRTILDHSQKRVVTLNEELNALKLYLELESKRLEASFDYRIHTGAGVDAASVLLPPLIIQPFVENAIWHGLRGKKYGGHIEISINNGGDGLLIVVQDDGVGRSIAGKAEKVKETNSFGTAATIQRILLHDPGSTIDIEDLFTENGEAAGTKVTISLHHNIS